MIYGNEPTEGEGSLEQVKVRRGGLPQRDGMPPIERELERARAAAAKMDDALGGLTRHLSSVLGPERPEPVPGEIRQTEDAAPLTNALGEHADHLENLTRALTSLSRRVEL